MGCNTIQKLRVYRFYNMAILDWLLTIIGAYILAVFIDKYITNISFIVIFVYTLIFLIILAIYLHWLFNIKTTLGYYLGINNMPKIVKCL